MNKQKSATAAAAATTDRLTVASPTAVDSDGFEPRTAGAVGSKLLRAVSGPTVVPRPRAGFLNPQDQTLM